MPIKKRKLEHIEICLNKKVDSDHNYWDDVNLVHKALPGMDKSEISTEITLLGKKLNYPILIGAMGGDKILNENCAKVASELGIGFCVGSQRVTLEKPETIKSFSVIKKYSVPLVMANIGAAQLIQQKDTPPFKVAEIKKIMEMINADLLTIHLNFPQEMIQPEGDENARGILNKIKKLSENFLVVVKEAGFGISKEVALLLKNAGVKGIEISGVSGTSWTAVEYYRAIARRDKNKERMGKILWNWGIPSPTSVLECKEIGLPIIGSGGIRHGLDVARAIALGASAVAIAKVLLKNALESPNALKEQIQTIEEELRVVMFLTGCKNIGELKKTKYILTGKLNEWKEQRKL